MAIPSLPLNSGTSIPQLGLGTWPMDDSQVAELVVAAAPLGYRHIDSALRYGNEAGVGEGIRRTGIARAEFFVTTKLDGSFQGDDKAVGGLEGSLERMHLDYVDLLLMHWPLPSRDLYVSTWRTFEKLLADGRARAIGVSNFKVAHLERLAAETETVPAVNQIQLSPFYPRPAQRAYDAEHGIVTESWSPLGGPSHPVVGEPVLGEVAAKHSATPGQVVLAWHLQQGLVAIPKTATPARLRENLEALDLTLESDDFARIATLSQGDDAGVDSDHDGH